jgi:hypothetical protein
MWELCLMHDFLNFKSDNYVISEGRAHLFDAQAGLCSPFWFFFLAAMEMQLILCCYPALHILTKDSPFWRMIFIKNPK